MRNLTFALLFSQLLSALALAQSRPPAPPPDQLATPGHPGWIVSEPKGCWVWHQWPDNAVPATATWSGECDSEGKADGRGVVAFAVSGKFSGQFEGELHAGKLQGYGVGRWSSGASYDGEFRDGQLNGYGVGVMRTGDRYAGQWKDNKKHGRGTMTWANGERYEGEWSEDELTGRGIYVWPNGNRYEGEFKESELHGRGTKTWADGDRYVGSWAHNRPEGYGEFWLGDSYYAGNWVSGCLRNGQTTAAIDRPISECR